MAFLVAWSALIIAITAKTVSMGKEFESKIAKTGWDLENNQSMLETLKADTENITAELLPRIDAITQENKQLRQQLGMPEPADDHVR